MHNPKISAEDLNQALPIDLTLLSCNSAGAYTIPKGTACLIQKYSGTRLVVWMRLEEFKKVHPLRNSASFFFGASDPRGAIIENKITDWREGSPTYAEKITNPVYLALLPLVGEK
jgi:hypothetical protein